MFKIMGSPGTFDKLKNKLQYKCFSRSWYSLHRSLREMCWNRRNANRSKPPSRSRRPSGTRTDEGPAADHLPDLAPKGRIAATLCAQRFRPLVPSQQQEPELGLYTLFVNRVSQLPTEERHNFRSKISELTLYKMQSGVYERLQCSEQVCCTMRKRR